MNCCRYCQYVTFLNSQVSKCNINENVIDKTSASIKNECKHFVINVYNNQNNINVFSNCKNSIMHYKLF